MAAKTLLRPSGIAALRRHLQDELPSLMQAPVLVIASGTGDSNNVDKEVAKKISESCKLVQFTLAQQMGLRTVPSTVHSAFPTLNDMEERRELVRRTGAAAVVAVGSGAAIDLAMSLDDNVEQVILVPSTYAGVMAAGASHSLVLDAASEETLVPRAASSQSTSVCPLDAEKYMAPIDPNVIVNACSALILDASYRQSKSPLLDELLLQLERLLKEQPNLSHESAIDLLYQCGQAVSFGLEGADDRSSPLTLAASLIPRIFPHVPILSFYASLVPGLCSLLSHQSNSRFPAHLLDRITQMEAIRHLTVKDESLDGFSVPDMALSHIQTNQNVWKSLDLPDADLIEILKHSIQVSHG